MVLVQYLYTSSEVAGFAKTGGLADVAAALPHALSQRGHDCAILMPLYRAVRDGPVRIENLDMPLSIPVGNRLVHGGLWRATLPGSGVPVYLVEQPQYFERDDDRAGRSIYQYAGPDGHKHDYADNCERFIFFSRAILEAMRLLDFWPDVLHNNDWQTGLVPVYLREEYQQRGPEELRRRYQQVAAVFTIHNMAYQGVFWHLDMPLTGLPWRLYNPHQLEYYNRLSFLKAGIVFSDAITTVSPTYAREIQTPYFGYGMQGVLVERRDRLHGIVNGVDERVWDPAKDNYLAATYNVETVNRGKPACKAALQRFCGLPERPRTPLLGMVTRLVRQKGLDLLVQVGEQLLGQDLQLVVLGRGDVQYHRYLDFLRERYPNQVSVHLTLDEALAHQIEAGADLFLMPSEYEPCGLNQLYSLKYGTVPVVHVTGGLADTVINLTEANLDRATGFAFGPYTAHDFRAAVERAVRLYRERPSTWLRLQQNGMRQDWSWNHSAAEYERLFLSVVARPG
jgi:starch synthase